MEYPLGNPGVGHVARAKTAMNRLIENMVAVRDF